MTVRPVGGSERLVCPACGHVFYPQLKVGAGSLVIQDGTVLLIKRGPDASAFPNTWGLPAGYCEADEPPAVTAARETEEETGLKVLVTCLSGTYHFEDDPRGNGVLLVYEANPAGGQLQADGQESVTVGFFPPDGLPEPLCGGGHDQAIQAWQERALDRWNPGEAMRYCPYCTCPLEDQPAYGRVRPVCPTCGYIHFLTPKVGVSVLVEQEDRVLLVRRAIEPGLGQWSLPSGFIEWDESPETAAVREVAEETGLTVTEPELLDAGHYGGDYRGPGLNLNYRAHVISGTPKPADDAAEVRFYAREDLPPLDEIAFESHRRLLARWREGR
jgi:8-oxo-dGTP diphosphatase